MDTTTEYRADDIDPEFPEGAEMPDRPFFTVADLAEIGARLRGDEQPLRSATISQYLFESGEEIPVKAGGTRRGRYADDPFPKPDGYVGKAPWWDRDREDEVVAWFGRHPRRMKGDGIGGRKPKASE